MHPSNICDMVVTHDVSSGSKSSVFNFVQFANMYDMFVTLHVYGPKVDKSIVVNPQPSNM